MGNRDLRLSRSEALELIDLLRKNMLYQTPRPVFRDAGDAAPTWVDLRMVYAHQSRIVELIHKAGGWIIPREERLKVIARHEETARRAHGDGVDYDFAHLSYGDLVAMYDELEGVEKMAPFRAAILTEIDDRDVEGAGYVE